MSYRYIGNGLNFEVARVHPRRFQCSKCKGHVVIQGNSIEDQRIYCHTCEGLTEHFYVREEPSVVCKECGIKH